MKGDLPNVDERINKARNGIFHQLLDSWLFGHEELEMTLRAWHRQSLGKKEGRLVCHNFRAMLAARIQSRSSAYVVQDFHEVVACRVNCGDLFL